VSGFLAEWEAWRDARELALRSPAGYLAITALHWLTEDPQRFDDVPGEWSGRDHGAVVLLGRGETLSVEGSQLSEGAHVLGPLDQMGVTLSYGDWIAQVADRGGTTILRPRHPDAPILRAYLGTPCYPPDERWVLPGLYVRYDSAQEDRQDDDLAGDVVFEHDGVEHQRQVWEDEESLWILFRDATSGITTYVANRQLSTGLPSPEGRVLLDFNRAANMPCAYTAYATCPVTPPGNSLPFAVQAGEQIPEFSGMRSRGDASPM